MLVYTPHITSRIRYIIHYFNEQLFVDAELTDDIQLYKEYQYAKINYSLQRISVNEFHIQTTGLLHEQTIKKHAIECFEQNGAIAFYKTKDDLGFDIFSAVFYLITRYEEYLPHEPDAYGRYAHWNSLAWKQGFLQKPLVDIWLNELGNQLKQKFSNFNFQSPVFQFLPTYDIDIAWSYKHKGLLRNIAASINSPFSILKRVNVLSGINKDPFDCYDWLQQLHLEYKLKPLYFFLVAGERSQLDKNISPKRKALQKLILQTSNVAEIGLHPSVFSNTAKSFLAKEKNTLQQILHTSVVKSRQHYLRFFVPHSYRELIAAGITNDYSMGYGTVNGFRASTSNSFLWYDLEKEETTSLRIHPFAFMEANSFYELHQSPAEALNELMQLYREVKKVNGTIITVFHNHFLGTDKMFRGWKEMYAEFINFVSTGNAE